MGTKYDRPSAATNLPPSAPVEFSHSMTDATIKIDKIEALLPIGNVLDIRLRQKQDSSALSWVNTD